VKGDVNVKKEYSTVGKSVTRLDAHLVEASFKDGPFGAKTVGEPASVPTAAAIANAIGVRIKELPITPDKIVKALKNRA
jgi:CO/xanthine dehydrogenase Mo-binding subunit